MLNDLYPGMFSITDPWWGSPKLMPNLGGEGAGGEMTPDMFMDLLNKGLEENRKILQERREGKK